MTIIEQIVLGAIALTAIASMVILALSDNKRIIRALHNTEPVGEVSFLTIHLFAGPAHPRFAEGFASKLNEFLHEHPTAEIISSNFHHSKGHVSLLLFEALTRHYPEREQRGKAK